MTKLQTLMNNLPQGMDGALILSQTNRQYYTGMRSTAGVLLVTHQEAYFLVDFRYYEAACKQVTDCSVVLQEKLYPQLQELMGRHNLHRVGVEDAYLTLAEFAGLEKNLPVELVHDGTLSRLIFDQRMVKTPDEVAQIKRAQEYTDRAFLHILDYIRPGRTEREIALELEFFARRLGADWTSFNFIVVAGENGSQPHGVPGNRPVKDGDFVTMDFGVRCSGYCSDMTRTVAVGAPSEKQRQVYDLVLKAHLESMAAVKPGIPCEEIDAVARNIITQGGYGEHFGHALGHGVGLEIHEEPRFGMGCKTLCAPGQVVTIEPGIYLPGEFGVRIENMVLVTPEGHEDLTKSTRDLLVL